MSSLSGLFATFRLFSLAISLIFSLLSKSDSGNTICSINRNKIINCCIGCRFGIRSYLRRIIKVIKVFAQIDIINIASPEQIKAAFGDNSEASVSKAVEALKAENALYAQYFSGTVFDITEYKTNGVVIDTENNKFAASGADAIDAYLQENTDGVKLGE